MKALFTVLVVLLSLFSISVIQAQKPGKIYKAIVVMTDGTKERGLLIDADRTGLYLNKKRDMTTPRVIHIPGEKIEVVKLVQRGKGLLGAGIGAVTVGGIMGAYYIIGDPSCGGIGCELGQGAAVVALSGMGAITGAKILGKRTKYPIKGDIMLYEHLLPEIQLYAYRLGSMKKSELEAGAAAETLQNDVE